MEELEGRLDHIMEFQLSDIEKALELATANFLATQGAVVCTEFLGGIVSGTLGVRGKERARFEAGLQLLGEAYRKNSEELWKLRCSILHSYLPEGKPGRNYYFTNDAEFDQGFVIRTDQNSGREEVTVNPRAWVVHLRRGYADLLQALRTDEHRRTAALKCLEKLPGLA